jgi:hypothetical protein
VKVILIEDNPTSFLVTVQDDKGEEFIVKRSSLRQRDDSWILLSERAQLIREVHRRRKAKQKQEYYVYRNIADELMVPQMDEEREPEVKA